MTTFKLIDEEGEDLEIVRLLFREYAAELQEDLCFQSFDAEVKDPLKKYVQPGGCIILAHIDGEPAGCIALMPMESAACEMKRLYVRPAYRKTGLGKVLVAKLINFAEDNGFHKMKLDTLGRLQPAIRLYERFGFTHTNPYYSNPISDAVYMEKQLR
ncbi:MAG TPA: GNAT family N-acetyltransferase [Chitinophagaceae bacterium]